MQQRWCTAHARSSCPSILEERGGRQAHQWRLNGGPSLGLLGLRMAACPACAGAPGGAGGDARKLGQLARRAANILRGARQLEEQRGRDCLVRARAWPMSVQP